MRKRVTHCARSGHEFTAENTYIAPSRPNVRVCRKCKEERHAAWVAAHPDYQRAPKVREWHRANAHRYRTARMTWQREKRFLIKLNSCIATAIAPIEPLGIWL